MTPACEGCGFWWMGTRQRKGCGGGGGEERKGGRGSRWSFMTAEVYFSSSWVGVDSFPVWIALLCDDGYPAASCTELVFTGGVGCECVRWIGCCGDTQHSDFLRWNSTETSRCKPLFPSNDNNNSNTKRNFPLDKCRRDPKGPLSLSLSV